MLQSRLQMKTPITYADFEKLDIRVGTVVEATAPEWSKKLLRFVVDFGPEIGQRIIFSGIRTWYQPETLIGKQFGFLINLEPKKMGEEESQGMMMMVDGEEQPTLIPLTTAATNGTMIR